MILNEYPYLVFPERSGRTEEDVSSLLLANGKRKTEEHVRNVAREAVCLGRRFGLDETMLSQAGYLHDVSAVIRPEDMLKEAKRRGMELCEAEERYPFLLHQRMSVLVAEEYFGVTDERILSAIGRHTTLRPDASPEDMTIFLADKLAWDQDGAPPFEETVRSALDQSLGKGCLAYMIWMEECGKLLCPHENWTLAIEWLRRTEREVQ